MAIKAHAQPLFNGPQTNIVAVGLGIPPEDKVHLFNTPLFKSEHKFDSGSGWHSFDRTIKDNAEFSIDYDLGYGRNEEHCATCGGHLGHVFNDGPRETTGKRHCINGVALKFIPKERRQGFDFWQVLECTHDYNNSFYYEDSPERLKWKEYDAIAQTKSAIGYINEKSQEDKPFVLMLSWGPPHAPYQTAPQKYRAMYSPKNIKLIS